MDDLNLEHIAESHIISQLTRHGITVAKPYGDKWGADLLAMLSVYDHAKFIRVQSKGRRLENKSSNIKIPKEYLTSSFCLFLYVYLPTEIYSNHDYLFVFFQHEIENIFSIGEANGKQEYRLNFSRKDFLEILSPFKASWEKFEDIKKIIRDTQEIDPWTLPFSASSFDKASYRITKCFRGLSSFINCDWNSWTSSSQKLFKSEFISEKEYQAILILKQKRDEITFSKNLGESSLDEFLRCADKISVRLEEKLVKLNKSFMSNEFNYFMMWFRSELGSLQSSLERLDVLVPVQSLSEFGRIMDSERVMRTSYAEKNLDTTIFFLKKLKEQIATLLGSLSDVDPESDAIKKLKEMLGKIPETIYYLNTTIAPSSPPSTKSTQNSTQPYLPPTVGKT
jgi:PD-(D/E)XK endonuclease